VFTVTVPEGTLLYHGDAYAKVPDIPEWLAFEVEHGEFFARKPMFAPRTSGNVQAVASQDAFNPRI
jgi:hypothetical protein